MKILILSDSHGDVAALRRALKREQPDRVFHLGDMITDAKRLSADYPELPVEAVVGNCDGWAGVEGGPEQRLVTVEGVRFLLTHGHRYHVKMGEALLARSGREAGADVICFGHTHQAVCRREADGVWMVNPGSVGGIHAPATYAVARVEKGSVQIELQELKSNV